MAGAAALLVTAGTLAACGGDGGGSSTLTWYINPDAGGQAEIAERCSDASGGRVDPSSGPSSGASGHDRVAPHVQVTVRIDSDCGLDHAPFTALDQLVRRQRRR